MTKILYIISDRQFGGGSRHLFDLISNLDKQKFEPVLVSPFSPIMGMLKNKIKTYQLKMKSRLDFSAIKKMRQIIRHEKPNLIHLHSTRAGILGTLAAKNLGIPIIYTEHLFTKDYIPPNRLIHFLQLKTLKSLSPYLTKIIAVSQAVKNYLVNNQIFPQDKIEVIYNGVVIKSKTDIKRDFQATSEVETPHTSEVKEVKDENRVKYKKTISIGSIGALTKIKGYKYLIETLKIINSIKRKLPVSSKVEGEIIGDGPEIKNLQSQIFNLKLENKIKIIPMVTSLEKTMADWDIYVQPSLSESFGLAIAQAMAVGLPVIATKVGGIPELIGKAGLLVPAADAKVLVSAIIKLVKNPHLSQKLGRAGRKRIEKYFSLDRMVKQTEKLYQKIARHNFHCRPEESAQRRTRKDLIDKILR